MARIRKSDECRTQPKRILWKIGKYIRLSRDDGNLVSESIINQDNILNDEIPHFFESGQYEIVDTYIDDGTSGTTDIERRDFQRMARDMQTGRINCIIVKNLSRAFRNSANQGRFLEEFIPLYHTRFISLYQPRIDTFLDPEVVHSLEVSITGFMNEQYAYKTSADVRRTFRHKREKGEFIGAFAPYGYAKDPRNKNVLVIDEYAAQVVRDIYTWFVSDGMSKAGIAKRLNDYGIPNPTAYKRGKGFRYENPHAAQNDGLWNPTTIARMLQDQVYIGTMRQGRQRVISYKVHKRAPVPESEWFIVENAVPAIISRETFRAAQELHKRDARTSPGKREVYLFSGFVRCADCKKSMTRRTSRGLVYYACRTYQTKSKTQCAKHSIRLDILEQVVLAAIQKQLELVETLSQIIEEISGAPVVHRESLRLHGLLEQRTKELEKVTGLLDGLYMDWKSGDLTRDQYRRMRLKWEEQAGQLQETVARLQQECHTIAQGADTENPYLTTFLSRHNVQTLSRGLLVELVNAIYIHRDGRLDIEFHFSDPYRRIMERMEDNRKEAHDAGGKIGEDVVYI